MRTTRIALTMGDMNGIGPEIILKALRHEALLERKAQYVIVGSCEVFRYYAAHLSLPVDDIPCVTEPPAFDMMSRIVLWDIHPDRVPTIRPGQVDAQAGTWAMQAVTRATSLCLAQQASAMVTAPISKAAIRKAGYLVPGHTEFIASLTNTPSYLMTMVAGSLRVALVTTHIPLREVPAELTYERILEKAELFYRSLQRDFGLHAPRMAVLGLNPHAGEGGLLGEEEERLLKPAIAALRERAWDVHGPFPADSFFGVHRNHFDGVLAMYHDQGLGPFKALAFDQGVNYTAGLPIVRTSPDHGTAFEIAGKGVASEKSMVEAILLADLIARHRKTVSSLPS